jgi:hypothetical protein
MTALEAIRRITDIVEAWENNHDPSAQNDIDTLYEILGIAGEVEETDPYALTPSEEDRWRKDQAHPA